MMTRLMSTNPAVVANPNKADDPAAHRRALTAEAVAAGLPESAWFETTARDPGRGQCAQALDQGADLVFACCGDGAVRAGAAAHHGCRLAQQAVRSELDHATNVAGLDDVTSHQLRRTYVDVHKLGLISRVAKQGSRRIGGCACVADS